MSDRQELFAKRLDLFCPIDWEQIPDFGLYMDQVITFIERQCKTLYGEGERIFTPAMVNNYVKMGLVNRPIDKKYGREQLAQLLMICTLKQGASADGMKLLLALPEGVTMRKLYEDFCAQQRRIFGELAAALPLPSVMNCVIHNAAYAFLCNALLQKQETPAHDKPQAHDKKAQDAKGQAQKERGLKADDTNEADRKEPI